MIDIALFGGAFDPPTIGHHMIMKAVHASTGFDVWMMPCWKHKFDKQLTNPHLRIPMCEGVTDLLKPWAKVCRFEIKHELSGSMYETILKIKEAYSNHRFHLIIGSDNINQIEKWDRGLELINENPIIVIERPNYSIDPEKKKLIKDCTLVNLNWCGSSTAVREAITNHDNKFAARNLDWPVWEYIQNHRLYNFEYTEENFHQCLKMKQNATKIILKNLKWNVVDLLGNVLLSNINFCYFCGEKLPQNSGIQLEL